MAIETGHLLRLAFGRPWRQTEGLFRSIAALLGLELGIPDHTRFSRRSPGLVLATALARAQAGGGPVHVVIDATGLKVFGAGEWLAETHGARGKRTWRKLHLAVDPEGGEILPCELTTNEEGDASQVGPSLEQISGPLGSIAADGTYDGEAVYRAVSEHQPDPPVDAVIPPRSTAAPSPDAGTAPTQRDSGYNVRARVEGQIGRWKRVIGDSLRFHTDKAQAAEVAIAVEVLNHMLDLGRPNSVHVA